MPAPSTTICTRDDGIGDWQACRTGRDGGAVLVLDGARLAISRSPAALSAIVERLAECSGNGR